MSQKCQPKGLLPLLIMKNAIILIEASAVPLAVGQKGIFRSRMDLRIDWDLDQVRRSRKVDGLEVVYEKNTNFPRPLMIYEYMPPLQRKTCPRYPRGFKPQVSEEQTYGTST